MARVLKHILKKGNMPGLKTTQRKDNPKPTNKDTVRCPAYLFKYTNGINKMQVQNEKSFETFTPLLWNLQKTGLKLKWNQIENGGTRIEVY
jgi:hypothetical protein